MKTQVLIEFLSLNTSNMYTSWRPLIELINQINMNIYKLYHLSRTSEKLENWRKIRNYRERERERTPEKKRRKKTEHRFADHGTEDRREARIRRDSRIKQKNFQY